MYFEAPFFQVRQASQVIKNINVSAVYVVNAIKAISKRTAICYIQYSHYHGENHRSFAATKTPDSRVQ